MGFNLVELLVVVALIMSLAGFLLPALIKLRSNARDIKCLSNSHQLTLAWTMYAGDFQDTLPLNGGPGYVAFSISDPNIRNGNWVHGVMGFQGGATPTSNTDPRLVEAGSLFPYAKSVAIYKCPADKKTAVVADVPTPTSRSVSMNAFLNPIVPIGSGQIYRKRSQIIRPSPANLWVFIDESPATINDGFFVCDPIDYPTTWVDIPAAYHNGGSGISFADGHSQIKKWRDPVVLRMNSSTYSAALQFPPTDLNWLQSHSTDTSR